MDPSFWHERWSENRIGFHQLKINKRLQTHWPNLKNPEGSSVFVPLCGKSLDMLWLADQGYKVVGIEISSQACKEFFVENNIKYRVEPRGAFTAYVSQSVTLLAGDFFDLSAADLQGVEGFYDRAALIALPHEMRAKYAAHLTQILPDDCQGLLLSITYDEDKMPGPPFSVDEKEINKLLEPGFSVELIAKDSGAHVVGNLKNRGLDTLEEKVYHLVRRS